MKITVTNHDKTTEAVVTHRKGGLRVGQFQLAPGETKEFEIERTDEAFSFALGTAAAKAAPAPVAAKVAPAPKPADPAPQPAKPSWNELRANAIALGAPKTVSKAVAEKTVAAGKYEAA